MSGLYIHIPFCHSKCAYCDFYSAAGKDSLARDYVNALALEYEHRRGAYPTQPDTIYLGGGTPSSLSTILLYRIIEMLPTREASEVTIEVNPEDVTDTFCQFLSDTPAINRVSMGVQSLNPSELAAIGRRHSAEDAIRAVKMLRQAGVRNLSLDLIFGLPEQTLTSWHRSLEGVLSLSPEHLSAYSLMLEPGTRLWAQSQANRLTLPSQDDNDAMYHALCHATAQAGMLHYEISNYAMPGMHSRHNSAYWNLTPYLGLGASAHSFDGTARSHNPASLRDYMANPTGCAEVETITADERLNEYLMLRLRTAEGLDINELESRCDIPSLNRIKQQARPHLDRGTLVIEGSRLKIPEHHWLISDSVLVDLFL